MPVPFLIGCDLIFMHGLVSLYIVLPIIVVERYYFCGGLVKGEKKGKDFWANVVAFVGLELVGINA